MIAAGNLGVHRLLQWNAKGVPLAWVALGLSLPVQALRSWITHNTASEVVHRASIFAKHPEYATILIAVWALVYDMVYLRVLLATRSASVPAAPHDGSRRGATSGPDDAD